MRPATHALIQSAAVPVIFVVDRVTKYWAQTSLAPVHEIRVLPFFHLTYLENTGAAWGMFQGRNPALIIVSAALLGALLYLRRKWRGTGNAWMHYGVSLVAGGALGNLYDRLVYGYVVDFLDFLVWPVFNVADSCITVGACMLAWGLHLHDRQERSEPN